MRVLKCTTIGGMKRNNSRHLNTYKKIGNNIRYQRCLKGFSQEDLALEISSARNYIGCIERGEKFPSIAILIDISHVLNCKLSDLFNGV